MLSRFLCGLPYFVMTEQEIIKGCIQGDRLAQSKLYANYYALMYNIVTRYASEEDDKQALINGGFFKVLDKINQYNNSYALATWIRNILVHNCIDDYRKKKRAIPEVALDELAVEPVLVEYNDAINEIETREVLAILLQLPEASRNVFNLYAIDGYSHKEIAKMMDISPGTSRWHLNAARMKLKKLLEKKMHRNQSKVNT